MIAVSSGFARAVLRGVLGYVATAFAVLLGYVVLVGSIQGASVASLAYGLVEYLWFGWIYVLAGLPVAVTFLVVLYGWGLPVASLTRPRIVLLSISVWSVAAMGLALLLTAAGLLPDTPTIGRLVEAELYVAALGAIFGVAEALGGGHATARATESQP
jgi:hypothetical protein